MRIPVKGSYKPGGSPATVGRPGCQQRCSHKLPTVTYRTCLLPNVPLGSPRSILSSPCSGAVLGVGKAAPRDAPGCSHPTSSRYQINPQPPLSGKAPSSLGKDGQTLSPKVAAFRTEGIEHGSGSAQPAGDHGAADPTPSPLLRSPGQGSAGESGLRLFCFRQPELVKRKKGSLSRGRGSNPVMCL